MARHDSNPYAHFPLRYLKIPEDVAWDVLCDPRPVTGWALLNKRGEYICIETETAGVDKATFSSWPEAMLGAELHGAEYIVAFHHRKVMFRVMSPSNTPTWWPVRVLGVPDSMAEINHIKADRYEPDAEGNQPKRKQLSGAQKRKLYGTPPSRRDRRR